MPIKPPYTMTPKHATAENIAEYEVNKLARVDRDGNRDFDFNPLPARAKVADHYRRALAEIEAHKPRSSRGSDAGDFIRKLITDEPNPYQAPMPTTTQRRNAKGQLLCAGRTKEGTVCNSWINKSDEQRGERYCRNHRYQDEIDDPIMLICAGRCGAEISEFYVERHGPVCPSCLESG